MLGNVECMFSQLKTNSFVLHVHDLKSLLWGREGLQKMLQVPATIQATAGSSVSLQHGWEGGIQESSLHLAGKEISVFITNLRASAQMWRRRWHGVSLPLCCSFSELWVLS